MRSIFFLHLRLHTHDLYKVKARFNDGTREEDVLLALLSPLGGQQRVDR